MGDISIPASLIAIQPKSDSDPIRLGSLACQGQHPQRRENGSSESHKSANIAASYKSVLQNSADSIMAGLNKPEKFGAICRESMHVPST